MGVNTHPWYEWDKVKPKLKELGIRHIRETRGDAGLYQELYNQYGIKTTLIGEPHHYGIDDLMNFVKEVGPEKFAAVSGPNEPWLFIKGDWVNIARDAQKTIWNRFKSDPSTKNIPIATPSPVFPDDAHQLGDLSQWADLADLHFYQGGHNPERKGDDWGTLPWVFREMRDPIAPGRPAIMSETGYHNTKQFEGHLGTPDLGVVAKYIPRLYLHHWKSGIVRSFVYELYDEGTDPHEQEYNFGLLRNDYSNKPSFEAVKNMIQLLNDRGSDFAPGNLDYSLSGNTGDVETLLLQKRNGHFFLGIWLAVSSADPGSQTAFSVSPQDFTISLPSNISGVVIHQLGADGKLTSKNATVSNGKLQMKVSDAVAFIEIGGSTGANSGSSGSGSSGAVTDGSQLQNVTVYENRRFTGRSQSFSAGYYAANKGQLNGVGNNKISSLRVPKGFRVYACENENEQGICRTYESGDYTFVGNDLNDKISYIKVESIGGSTEGGSGSSGSGSQPQNVTLYQNGNFTGSSQSFSVGYYAANKGQLNSVGNDQSSSIRVPKGFKAYVCENENEQGICRIYETGDYTFVGSDLNDKISYI
jgi:hypothetical protein